MGQACSKPRDQQQPQAYQLSEASGDPVPTAASHCDCEGTEQTASAAYQADAAAQHQAHFVGACNWLGLTLEA